MIKQDYLIQRVGAYQIIERTEFPRIRITLCVKHSVALVIRIKLIDKCSASLIVPVLADIENLIKVKDPAKLATSVNF